MVDQNIQLLDKYMATQPQLIFDRTIATEKEMKEIKAMIRDALINSASYQEVQEEIKNLKQKAKQIKDAIMEDFNSEQNKLDVLKTDKENDKMLLSDAALSKLIKGEHVEVEDEKGNKYEPIFTVKFKKI